MKSGEPITSAMKSGEYASVTGAEVKALREQYGLSQTQFAVLARSSVTQKKNGTFHARRVWDWEHDRHRVPLPSWELVTLKLKLMEAGATFEQFAEHAAADVAVDVMDRYRKTLSALTKT